MDDSSCTTVNIPDGTYKERITINRDVELLGNSREGTILNGQDKGPVITIGTESGASEINITVKNMTVKNGYNTENGGGVVNWQGYGSFVDVIFKNNETEKNGGGFYNDIFIVEFSGCRFIRNKAKYDGGGMYSLNGNVVFSSTSFWGNEAIEGGGGGYIGNGALIFASTFAQNKSEKAGGGIYVTNSPMIVDSTIVENSSNSSTKSGGIYSEESMAILNSIIAHNSTGDCFMQNSTDDWGDGGWPNLDSDGSCGLDSEKSFPNTDPQLVEFKSGYYYQPIDKNSAVVDTGTTYYSDENKGHDQRGFSRPEDGNQDGIVVSDIGAIELQPLLTPEDVGVDFYKDQLQSHLSSVRALLQNPDSQRERKNIQPSGELKEIKPFE